jgi:hypothetical protein
MPAIRSALVVSAVWSIAIGAYFAFRDDATQPMTEMQITYEDRIADLRAQFDRIISRQFLDQEHVQQQLNALLQRQATLEQRTSALTDDQSVTGSINPKAPAPDCGSIASVPPVVELPGALASTPKSASPRQRHGPRAHRRPAARPRQHAGDQAAPAATQLDLGKPSFTQGYAGALAQKRGSRAALFDHSVGVAGMMTVITP